MFVYLFLLVKPLDDFIVVCHESNFINNWKHILPFFLYYEISNMTNTIYNRVKENIITEMLNKSTT